MKQLDPAQRYELCLRADVVGPSKAAKELGYNVKTARIWYKRYLESGRRKVEEKERSGRKHLLSEEASAEAAKLLLDGAGYAEQVSTMLFNAGLVSRKPHTSTLLRSARLEEDVEAVRGQPRKDITPANKEARVAFAESNRGRSWEMFYLQIERDLSSSTLAAK